MRTLYERPEAEELKIDIEYSILSQFETINDPGEKGEVDLN